MYPPKRSFRPESCLAACVSYVQGSNYDAKKNPFLDKFCEPNSGAILHTCGKSPAVYRNAEWMTKLRGDREERIKVKLRRDKRNSKSRSPRKTSL